ncbi:MAG: methyltransferase domain-containing protein [Oscillospiraceae bacterium]|nr:methyltransferase domain-containing protein [Oscillospiraceae bacterium]
MSVIASKNKANWNAYAEKYSRYEHSEQKMSHIAENPANAFDPVAWEVLHKYVPGLKGKKVCVPSSGDNHAVYAFAMMGACVTSCDISENQLANAERAAKQYGWDKNINFICADTMLLNGIKDDEYDFVYTSNGVHVWIDDLSGMYRSIYRVMKPGGMYMMYEIHPFQRPFGYDGTFKKSYEATGPFDNEDCVTFGWRVMDIMNAVFHSGLVVRHMEEILPKKNYEWPFWFTHSEILDGAAASREEVDRRWEGHKMALLPEMLVVAAQKLNHL